MSKKQNGASKAGMFILGSAIGVAAGMLLAQKKGSELRDEIVETANVVKEKAVDAFERKEEIIENILESIERMKNSDEFVEFLEPEYYEKEFTILKDEILNNKDEIVETVDSMVKDLQEEAQNLVDKSEFIVEEKIDEVQEKLQ